MEKNKRIFKQVVRDNLDQVEKACLKAYEKSKHGVEVFVYINNIGQLQLTHQRKGSSLNEFEIMRFKEQNFVKEAISEIDAQLPELLFEEELREIADWTLINEPKRLDYQDEFKHRAVTYELILKASKEIAYRLLNNEIFLEEQFALKKINKNLKFLVNE